MGRHKSSTPINEVRNVSVTDVTKELITVKAKMAGVYNNLTDVLCKIEEDCDAQHLKDSMLEADMQMMHYISKLIDLHLTESDYTQM